MAARAKSYGRHEDSELPDDSLEEMFKALEPLTPLNTEIKRCITFRRRSQRRRQSWTSPCHDGRCVELETQIHTQLNSILNSSRTYLQDAVITMRDGRYCLPVKAEHKNQVSGMVHDQSATGSTLFIEPMAIIKLNNDLRELEIQEKKEIEAVLADLSNQTAPYTEELPDQPDYFSSIGFYFCQSRFHPAIIKAASLNLTTKALSILRMDATPC